MCLESAEYFVREIEDLGDLTEEELTRLERLRHELIYLRREMATIETRARSLRDLIEMRRD